MKLKVKECMWCKKPFMPHHVSQIYCGAECKRHAESQKARERPKKYKSYKKKEKPRKRNDLAEIDKAARAAGLSYGQYVARMGK